jgi:hypothetical protein
MRCIFHLRRLRFICQQRGRDVIEKLVVALTFARLDYCNAVLAGLMVARLAPLQRVLLTAVRLINGLRPHDHVTTTLKELHWLLNASIYGSGVDYKLCPLFHKAKHRSTS